METYFLFRRAADVAPGAAAACAEQDEDIGSPSDSESSSPSTSRGSAGSSSSELDDDASSSGSDRRHFEMSTLMAQLPLKRGLSRFFDGKSQSFASLAAVGSLEDLAKPPRKRLKPSRSCGGGLDAHPGRLLSPRRHCPKATAARKVAARSGALAMLGAATRRPPLAAPARPEGVAGKVLVVG
ncbi:hypothetical protein ACP70R_026438 [Stipagrostis hirtigluma subsp. patula]